MLWVILETWGLSRSFGSYTMMQKESLCRGLHCLTVNCSTLVLYLPGKQYIQHKERADAYPRTPTTSLTKQQIRALHQLLQRPQVLPTAYSFSAFPTIHTPLGLLGFPFTVQVSLQSLGLTMAPQSSGSFLIQLVVFSSLLDKSTVPSPGMLSRLLLPLQLLLSLTEVKEAP